MLQGIYLLGLNPHSQILEAVLKLQGTLLLQTWDKGKERFLCNFLSLALHKLEKQTNQGVYLQSQRLLSQDIY